MEKILRSLRRALLAIIGSFIMLSLLKFGIWLLINYFVLGILFFAIGGISFLTFCFWVIEE